MNYEKDIPDFALVPAKEPEERVLVPITQGAVYSPVQVTNITEKPKTTITIEEDILVPDTKPDLKEILMIDGKVHLANREINQISKNEDYINVSGDMDLQTLYIPEKNDVGGPVISVQNRVTFKDQWHTELADGATMIIEGKIEKIEYMVVNERKYRVKILLSITAREYVDSKIDIFEGLTDEQIQVLKEKVEITNIALRKKDSIAIKEDIEIKDTDALPEHILKQDICVVENYKQATGEKVVINGFIYVNLLYSVTTQEGREADNICQLQERVEFTQFIPVQQGGQWSGSSICFDGSDLKIKLVQNDEGAEVFRLEGEIVTYLELYRNVEKEIIVDGYHKEKDFICDFEEASCRTLVGTTMGETSVREIISVEGPLGEVDKIIYATGEILNGESRCEAGKVLTEGALQGKLICRAAGEEGGVFATRQDIPFRCVTSVPQINGEETVSDRIYIKDLWAEKINSKQIELNATILVTSEIMRPMPFKVLKNPAFEEVQDSKMPQPMVVYIAKPDDNLWKIAKRFKTTMATISQVNQLEEDQLQEGQKLLILR